MSQSPQDAPKPVKSKFTSFFFKSIETLLGIAGFLLLVWMAHKIGIPVLKKNLLDFGLSATLFLILFYTLSQCAFCAAWYVLIKDMNKDLTFWKTFSAYAAGDALNMTVPSANLAGEPVKVLLIRDFLPFEPAMTSVTVYKFADIISMTIFLIFGWLNQFFFYSLPLSWNIAAGVVAGGMAAVCFLLYLFQNRGIYHPTGKWLEKIGLEKWIFGTLESAHLIDQGIRSFYQNHRKQFLLSIFFNFLAWFGGVLEITIFMAILGIPVSFAAALTIETFSLFINNVIFFVPARLGVGEGGRVLLFYTIGYTASAGLSYGIIRRIRELAWIGYGLCILLFRSKKQKAVIP